MIRSRIHPKYLALVAIGLSTLMSALDGSIVNIALPTIARTTRAPLSSIEWVVLIYLLTVSSLLLVFGRLGDIFGRRAIYITGQVVFLAASVLCALSPGIGWLIGMRAIQGIGAAMIFALGPAVLIGAFPPQERGRALGMQGTATYLGLAFGPTLGGYLTEHFAWPSIFWVNVPLGLVAIGVAIRALPHSEPSETQPFDKLGALLMALSLGGLLLAVTKGHEWGWGSPPVVGSLGVAVLALSAFIWVEGRNPFPVLDFGLFRNRVFSGATTAGFLSYMANAIVGFSMPFFLIQGSGMRESQAGTIMSAMPLAMMGVTASAGHLSDRIGNRIPSTVGMAVMASGALFLRTLVPGGTASHIALGMGIVGLGVGLFTAPNNSAIMGSAPESRRGVAGAVLAAARNVGFATGIAAAGVVFASRMATPGHPNSRQNIVDAVDSGLVLVAILCLAAGLLSALQLGRERRNAPA